MSLLVRSKKYLLALALLVRSTVNMNEMADVNEERVHIVRKVKLNEY